MEEYFTQKERDDLLTSLKDLSNVDIFIKDRDKGNPLHMFVQLPDRAAFFGKAKLWHVVKVIIQTLFLDDLINGKLSFEKADYIITVRAKKTLKEEKDGKNQTALQK